MSKLNNMSKPLIWSAALLLVAIVAGCNGSNGAPGANGTNGGPGSNGTNGSNGPPGTSAPGTNPSAINLLSASTYAVTTNTGLTTSGPTTFTGNAAFGDPAPACTATPPGGNCVLSSTAPAASDPLSLTITGTAISGVNATSVMSDLNTAWKQAASQIGGASIPGPGVLDGLTLSPGTYMSGSTMTLNAGQTLTLDAGGNANAVWIFQVGSSLTVNSATSTGATQVKLINGAQAKNVFWYVYSSASFMGYPTAAVNETVFAGTILAGAAITFQDGTIVTGRTLAGADPAQGGTVTTTSTTATSGVTVTP